MKLFIVLGYVCLIYCVVQCTSSFHLNQKGIDGVSFNTQLAELQNQLIEQPQKKYLTYLNIAHLYYQYTHHVDVFEKDSLYSEIVLAIDNARQNWQPNTQYSSIYVFNSVLDSMITTIWQDEMEQAELYDDIALDDTVSYDYKIQHLRLAWQINPNNIVPLLPMVKAYYLIGDYKHALDMMKILENRQVLSLELQQQLAYLYGLNGMYEKAWQYYEKMPLEIRYDIGHNAFINLLSERGEHKIAIEKLKYMIEHYTNNESYYYMLLDQRYNYVMNSIDRFFDMIEWDTLDHNRMDSIADDIQSILSANYEMSKVEFEKLLLHAINPLDAYKKISIYYYNITASIFEYSDMLKSSSSSSIALKKILLVIARQYIERAFVMSEYLVEIRYNHKTYQDIYDHVQMLYERIQNAR